MTTTSGSIDVALTGALGSFRLDATFRAPLKGITALFGPSGCGKTTILRCVAGLQRMAGRVSIGDAVWQDSAKKLFLPPHRREVGYVFQEANLFPHLSVRDNLLYGARRSAAKPADAPHDVAAIVDLLGIAALLDRSTRALSGGERQRIAVGRALLSRPRLLLMDEPLSALDRAAKVEIMPYLERLREIHSLPILYITHDMAEVERLADHIVLLERGRVLASGPLAALQTDTSVPLFASPEASTVLEGRVTAIDHGFGLTHIAVAGGEILAPGIEGAVGTTRRLRITATDVSISRLKPVETSILNCLPALVTAIEPQTQAHQSTLVLSLGADGSGARILARITRKSLQGLGLKTGDLVVAQIKGVALVS